MEAALLIALLVAVITLGWVALSQSKAIAKYENELTNNKARKKTKK